MIIAILFNNNSGFNINIIIEIVNVPIIKLWALLNILNSLYLAEYAALVIFRFFKLLVLSILVALWEGE